MKECPSCGAIEMGTICSFCEYELVKSNKPINIPPETLTKDSKVPLVRKVLAIIVYSLFAIVFLIMGIGAVNSEGDGLTAFISFFTCALSVYSIYKYKSKNYIIVGIAFFILSVLWMVSVID